MPRKREDRTFARGEEKHTQFSPTSITHCNGDKKLR
ncbi:uncharacterized protein G2W53_010739 [Senna tora]|uniref:Uncharacterized protein n=1 Tax=Senna tora TaxID=362788 RepID=A0A834WZV9_9FABA|nr:uncharacterized protein G2W53_010739 [Senna tora]